MQILKLQTFSRARHLLSLSAENIARGENPNQTATRFNIGLGKTHNIKLSATPDVEQMTR